MPLKLTPPVEKTFPLEQTDKLYESEGTTVTIRQASQLQHERRQDLWATMNSRFTNSSDVVELIQRFNQPELHRIEAMLTLVECNIIGDNNKPLFKFKKQGSSSILAMTEAGFKIAWGKLPVDIANEIHEKILEVNPTWSSQGEA